MPRPKNPFGDPVRVRLHRGFWRVRYYPTGFITEERDRKDLPFKYPSKETAEAAATVLRERLIAHRDIWSMGGVRHQVPLLDVATRFIEHLREQRDTRMMPGGTAGSRISDATLYLLPLARSKGAAIGDLEEAGLARQIIDGIDCATKKNGTPKTDNSRKRARASMRLFGKWLVSEGFVVSDPFGFLDLETEDTREKKRTDVRVKALERVDNDVYLDDGDSDTGIGLGDVPSLGIVSQLRDAIYAVETQTDALVILRRRILAPVDGWMTSQQPMFQTATGLRLSETLGIHTSRIDLATLTVGVDRQLDPRTPWIPGSAPELIPPKHNRPRRAAIWPVFAETLEQMVDIANNRYNGWLFPPTAGQTWRVKARSTEWERAIRHMALCRQQSIEQGVDEKDLAALWSWRPHFTRHTYGSFSLAPESSGGLGWSVKAVQESMGHRSETTTLEIYRHVTSGEREKLRTTMIEWENL